MFHKDPVPLSQIRPALQYVNKIPIALQLNSDQFAIPLLALVNQIIANSILTALTLILLVGTTAEFALLMVKNAVNQSRNVLLTLDAMTKILALKISACLSTVSAETLQDVMIIMNVLMTFAQLHLMENHTLALILLVAALKMHHSLMPTLSCLTINKKIEWLGKCDKKLGCITCVVTAQCDDHNGCSYDSCDKQYCLNAPINNQWCDPKTATQPIYYQSIPGLRDQLILAGYDISKLVN